MLDGGRRPRGRCTSRIPGRRFGYSRARFLSGAPRRNRRLIADERVTQSFGSAGRQGPSLAITTIKQRVNAAHPVTLVTLSERGTMGGTDNPDGGDSSEDAGVQERRRATRT